jgi:hypothetical protein
MVFSTNLKVFSKKLAEWVFLNVVMSEGDKETALRKRTGCNHWLLLVQATRKEVNSNGAIFFPKGTG